MTLQAVEALDHLHGEVVAPMVDSLTDEEWRLETSCEGWRVHEVIAHMSSTFLGLVEPPEPEGSEAPEVTAEEGIELLLRPRRDWSADAVREEYQAVVWNALDALRAMQEPGIADTVVALADLGEYPTHMMANAFAFDHYCHLRVDLLSPTGPLERTVEPATDAGVRPGIDWMLAGLPQMQPRQWHAFCALGEPVTLALTGPGGGEWTVSPSGAADITVAEGAGASSTATSTAHDFVSWGTTRRAWRDHVELTGPTSPLEALLDTMNIV